MVHDVSRRGERPAFALQLDVASFFPTVHKPTLLGLLARGFSAEERRGPLFALVRAVLLHDPTRAVRRCGPAEQFARVPLHLVLMRLPL